MTNYLDKEGLKKFWEITKGKYSLQGHTHSGILSSDFRSVDISPAYRDEGLFPIFRTNYADRLNDEGTYHGILLWRSYGVGTDFSGGYPIQIAYTANGRLWTRLAKSATAWDNWYKIARTNDIPTKLSQLSDDVVKGKYLPLSGGTLTGSLTTNSTLSVGGAATLNSSLTVRGEVKLSQKLTIDTGLSTDTHLMIGTEGCGIKVAPDGLNMTYSYSLNETDLTSIAPGMILTQCRHSGSAYGDVVIGEGIDYSLGVYGVEYNPSSWAIFGVNPNEGFINGYFDQLGHNGYLINEKGYCIGSDIESLTTYGREKIIVDDTIGNIYNINIPEKTGTIALDVDLAKYLPLSGGTISGNLDVGGTITKRFNGQQIPVLIVSDDGMTMNRPTALNSTLKVTGNVGIGTDADAAYKLKVNGKAYFSGDAIINGDLQVNGAINNGDFYTDMDGWAYTTQLNINDGGDLVMYDSNGDKHILNLQKAIELGVFS